MDPMSIVEDTEWTRFCPQMDRWTDGQTDKVKPVYPPFNFVEAGGIMIEKSYYIFDEIQWYLNDTNSAESPPYKFLLIFIEISFRYA